MAGASKGRHPERTQEEAAEFVQFASEIEEIKQQAMQKMDRLLEVYTIDHIRDASEVDYEASKGEIYQPLYEEFIEAKQELHQRLDTVLLLQRRKGLKSWDKATRACFDAHNSVQEELNRYFHTTFYKATGEFIAEIVYVPREQLRRRVPKKKGTDSPYLNALVACNIMLQLWHMGGLEDDTQTPKKESIKQGLDEYKASKRTQVSVEVKQNGDTEKVIYTLPKHPDSQETKPSPSLEAMASSVVYQAEAKLLQPIVEEDQEKAERRREQNRLAQKRYEQKQRETNLAEVQRKNAEKNRRWRAKKKQEAEAASKQPNKDGRS